MGVINANIAGMWPMDAALAQGYGWEVLWGIEGEQHRGGRRGTFRAGRG